MKARNILILLPFDSYTIGFDETFALNFLNSWIKCFKPSWRPFALQILDAYEYRKVRINSILLKLYKLLNLSFESYINYFYKNCYTDAEVTYLVSIGKILPKGFFVKYPEYPSQPCIESKKSIVKTEFF